MTHRFTNQTVWITGGGSGIGKAMALEFAKAGARVAISGRRTERLEEVALEIEALGAKSLVLTCDVTEESQVERAVQDILDTWGQLDVCVANAGFGVVGTIEQLSAEDWRRQLDVNVVGLAMTSKYALGPLRQSKGRLALIGSVAGYMGLAKNSAYCASKSAVRAIGQCLSIDLAGSGVSCTTIHPGFVESDIARVDNEGQFHEERKDRRPHQLMWTAERAAQTMVRAIGRREREFVFTGHGRIAAYLGQHFPGLTVFAQSLAKKRR